MIIEHIYPHFPPSPVPAIPNDMLGRPCVYGHIIDEKNIAFFREQNPALEEWKSFDPDTLLCTTSTMLLHGPCHTYSVPVHHNGGTAICWIYLDYRRHSSGRLVDKRPLNEPRIELEGILGISANTEPSWYLVAAHTEHVLLHARP